MSGSLITVEADTLEAALWKACLVLDCAPEEMAYVESDLRNAGVRLNALVLAGVTSENAALELSDELSEPLPLKPPQRIEEDIVPTAGRLLYFGDIALFGTIRAGAHVRARGKLTVWGDVESGATATASESVIVKGGLLGTARAVRGDVDCRYASGASILGRNITVTEDAIQTRVASTGKIDIGGMFCGGIASARQNIDAAIIGAPNVAAQTRVSAGQAKRLRQLAEQCAMLQNEAKSGWTAQFFAANSARFLSLSATPIGATINARQAIYPRCRIKIGQESLDIQREMHQASFWQDADTGILMTSHHEYE